MDQIGMYKNSVGLSAKARKSKTDMWKKSWADAID